MQEIWKEIEGYKGIYEVSNLGNVRRLKRKTKDGYIYRALKACLNSKGYFHVHLSNGKLSKVLNIHRLVAVAFIPNEFNKPNVNHKNGLKSDNRAENLEWVTHSENTLHAFENSLMIPTKGELNGRAKLTEVQVINIFKEYKEFRTPSRELARKYNVGKTAILDILSKRSWAHITKDM